MGGSRAVDRAVRQIELLRAASCQHLPRHQKSCVPIGRLNAVRTSWIADSIGDMGRKAQMAGMGPGTRSERANLAAIHRGHKPLQTCCYTRLHIPP